MSEPPEDIQRDSDLHRARIGALVDELRDYVTPAEIANQLLGRDAGREIVQFAGVQIRRQLRRNPIPVAIIGMGVAWLLLANAMRKQQRIPLHDGLDYQDYRQIRSPSSRGGIIGGVKRAVRQLSHEHPQPAYCTYSIEQEDTMANTHSEKHNGRSQLNGSGSYGGDAQQSGDTSSGLVGRTMQKGQQMATDMTHTALHKSGEAVSGAKQAVANTASSLMERTNEMARKTSRAASRTANRAGSGVGQVAREQPLLVAGVGFALGVALGALLPLTRAENELLGEQAERLKDSARDLASEGYERVKTVAQKSYDAATETLKSATENMGGQSGDNNQSNTQGSGASHGGEQGGNTASGSYSH